MYSCKCTSCTCSVIQRTFVQLQESAQSDSFGKTKTPLEKCCGWCVVHHDDCTWPLVSGEWWVLSLCTTDSPVLVSVTVSMLCNYINLYHAVSSEWWINVCFNCVLTVEEKRAEFWREKNKNDWAPVWKGKQIYTWLYT